MKENTFWEAIYNLRQLRLIPRQWTRADIRRHLDDRYSTHTINTIPSNQSITTDTSQMGNYVKRGLPAKAWRVGPGKFELIDDPYITSEVGIRPELNDPEEIRLYNIIDMGLQFSAMIRLFEKGSKRELHREILAQARKVFTAESEEHFKEIHLNFCDWGTQHIRTAEKKKNGQVTKKAGAASYGQIAKTFDVVLKVAVYYSHLPNCDKSRQISGWLNAAVDTRMMAMLKRCYLEDIASWPDRIERVDSSTYMSIQGIVRKFIAEKHNGSIIPVQFDDIYWKALNRQWG